MKSRCLKYQVWLYKLHYATLFNLCNTMKTDISLRYSPLKNIFISGTILQFLLIKSLQTFWCLQNILSLKVMIYSL